MEMVSRTYNCGQNSLGHMSFALKEAFPVCKLLPPLTAVVVAGRRDTCQLIYDIFISFQHYNGGGGISTRMSSKIQSVS